MSLLPPAVLLLLAHQGVAEEVVHLQAKVEHPLLLRVQEGLPAAAVQLVLLHTDTAAASMLGSGHMLAAVDSSHYSHSLEDSSSLQEGMPRKVEPCLAQCVLHNSSSSTQGQHSPFTGACRRAPGRQVHVPSTKNGLRCFTGLRYAT